MIVGFAPFYAKAGQDPDSIFRIIRKKKIIFPDPVLHGIYMSDDCKDFITKITQKDFKKRLGHENDVEDIITHPWFKEFNRRAFEAKKYTPEFIPKVSSNVLDDSNFDPDINKNEIDFSVLPKEAYKKIAEQ